MNLLASRRISFQDIRRNPLPALLPTVLAVSLAMPAAALAAGALPQGGHFVAGSGFIYSDANSVTIDSALGRSVIDWTSFSIGAGNHVSIYNTGPTLNRVTGADPSSIFGSLTSNGSVYLINPHGVLIGSSGVVTTAGRFVASTLDVDNTAFMNGGPLTFSRPSGGAKGTVVNLGKISSTGGDVFLIANGEVDNVGSISAPNGSTELVAGQQVLLQDSAGSQQLFVQQGSAGNVVNRGDIEAAQISLQAADGNVYALAGNHAVLRATGAATRDGHVWLVADTGRVWIDGAVEAANADGSGGTVDTTAARLRIAGGPTVKANVWNVRLPTFTLDGADAQVFQNNLNQGTSLNLQTTGAGGTTGDLEVASSLHWNGAASLTLGAYHSLTIDAASKLINDGTGNLTLRADASASDNGGSVVNNGVVNWSGSRGIVSAYYDINGTYRPGTMLANASWTSPTYSGITAQILAYKLIDNLTDLNHVATDLGSNYALGRDIDAGVIWGSTFTPIGSGNSPFTGQFDGQGHTISSLTVSTDPTVLAGLFDTLGASATVHDLNISGNVVSAGQAVAGILAGQNYGTVLRVNTSGNAGNTYFGAGVPVGGLVGENFGTIEGSSSSAFVASTAAGGLVGWNTGQIIQSHASGQVQGPSDPNGGPGGLVAVNEGGTITQSYATGLVDSQCSIGTCYGAGGLVYLNYYGTIDQSYATGTVDANGCGFGGCAIGAGLVLINEGSITRSYATGDVLALGCYSATLCSAGSAFVGYNQGSISQSFATGRVTGAVTQSPTGPTVQSYGIAFSNSGDIGNDVYWDKDSTGTSVGVGSGTALPPASGLIAAQMSNPASFSGWDFSSAGMWTMPPEADHPILRWQLQPPSTE